MTYEKEQENIRRLALLCLEKRPLTDEELADINQSGREVDRYFSRLGSFASFGAKNELKYRSRKKELDAVSTEELQRRWDVICRDRAATLAADTHDDLDDSFFEAPPHYTDEHILYEILEERKKAQPASV